MGKKTVVAAAGAVAAVGVAIGRRVSKNKSRQDETAGVPPRDPLVYEEVNGEQFVDALAEAIRFPTVVHDDHTYDSEAFDAQWAMLERRYPLAHENLEREVFHGHALMYTWEGSDSSLDPVVLMAHQDVVPVEPGTEDDWIKPAFEGAVFDGKVLGRGALDCKGPLIAVFEAVEYLLEQGATLERTVIIVSGDDEEIGGDGAKEISVALTERGITPWFVVDEGGAVADGLLPGFETPIALIGIAEKGFMNLKLTAHGEGGHSSMPPKETAIARLATAISAIESNPIPPRIEAITPMLRALSEHLPGVLGTLASKPAAAASLLSRVFAKDVRMDALQRSTMVPTMIEGGVKANVIPQTASVVVNVRMIPGDTSESVAAHIDRVVGTNVAIEVLPDFLKEPSTFSSIDSDAWAKVTGVVGEVFPAAIIAPWVLTAATDAYHFESCAQDVYRFSPFVLDEDGMGGLHGTNEFIRSEDARSAVTFFARLISVTAGMAD